MIALYIYVAFSYLFMAPYCHMDWRIRGAKDGDEVMGYIACFVLSPVSMPVCLGTDSLGGNKP